MDKVGTQVVAYNYDSWGKMTTSKAEMDDASDTNKNGITGTLKDTVGVKNPYRYRGYRYDTETGLYYLQSRYYNPEWGRMLNADAVGGQVGELLSHNVFAYCKNNPVTAKDPSGFRPVYTMDEETDSMRKASLKAASQSAAKINNSRKVHYNESLANSSTNNIAANIAINIMNSNKFKEAVKYGQEVYEEINKVKFNISGVNNVAGFGGQLWSAYGDFKVLASDSSYFQKQMTLLSLTSNIPNPLSIPVSIGTGVLREVYNYMPEPVKKALDMPLIIFPVPSWD